MDFSNGINDFAKRPAPNEFELSIFGPGIGECVLMHLGNGEWIVIDSCIFPGAKTAAALEYFEKLGIDPASAIKRILATHWHDDHVKGLADIVRRCPKAAFSMSAALQSDQFNRLVFEIEESNKQVSAPSTAREFAGILDELDARADQPPSGVSDGFLIFDGGYKDLVQVKALSPSASTVRNAQRAITHRLRTEAPVKKFKRLGANDLSVASRAAKNEHLINRKPRLRRLVPNSSCLVEPQAAISWDSGPRYPILFDCSRHGGLSRLIPAV